MAIKEFAIEWMKKKYPNDYLTTICDDVLEFAQDWADKVAVDFVIWNENVLEQDRETYEETYQDWQQELCDAKAIKDSKLKTPPSEQ